MRTLTFFTELFFTISIFTIFISDFYNAVLIPQVMLFFFFVNSEKFLFFKLKNFDVTFEVTLVTLLQYGFNLKIVIKSS